ncbi:MAG: hypothetical protein M1828_001262 [Chrysothrix sp. TS-e1954]|nr:MAG: hypothetical protein M1828_001262 [Chrysothrix sp. TS-e1954]
MSQSTIRRWGPNYTEDDTPVPTADVGIPISLHGDDQFEGADNANLKSAASAIHSPYPTGLPLLQAKKNAPAEPGSKNKVNTSSARNVEYTISQMKKLRASPLVTEPAKDPHEVVQSWIGESVGGETQALPSHGGNWNPSAPAFQSGRAAMKHPAAKVDFQRGTFRTFHTSPSTANEGHPTHANMSAKDAVPVPGYKPPTGLPDYSPLKVLQSNGFTKNIEPGWFHDALVSSKKGPLRPAATRPPSPAKTEGTTSTMKANRSKAPSYPHLFRLVKGYWPKTDYEHYQFSRDIEMILRLGSGYEPSLVEAKSADLLQGDVPGHEDDENRFGSPLHPTDGHNAPPPTPASKAKPMPQHHEGVRDSPFTQRGRAPSDLPHHKHESHASISTIPEIELGIETSVNDDYAAPEASLEEGQNLGAGILEAARSPSVVPNSPKAQDVGEGGPNVATPSEELGTANTHEDKQAMVSLAEDYPVVEAPAEKKYEAPPPEISELAKKYAAGQHIGGLWLGQGPGRRVYYQPKEEVSQLQSLGNGNDPGSGMGASIWSGSRSNSSKRLLSNEPVPPTIRPNISTTPPAVAAGKDENINFGNEQSQATPKKTPDAEPISSTNLAAMAQPLESEKVKIKTIQKQTPVEQQHSWNVSAPISYDAEW